jgi:glycine dehydrogenase
MIALCCTSRFARLSRRLCLPRLTQRALATLNQQISLFSPLDTFSERHIGPDDHETSLMLSRLGYSSMDAFIEDTVPPRIRVAPESLDNTSIPVLSESQLHTRAQVLGGENKRFKSYIGMGYHSAVVPPVILRNVCS